MKNLLFVLVFLMLYEVQAQSWSWVKNIENASISDSKTMPSGITYLTGTFTGIKLPDSAEPEDYVVIIMDSSGNMIGGITKSAAELSIGHQIGLGETGCIYVFGKPISAVLHDYNLQKFSPEGVLAWTRRMRFTNSIGSANMDVSNGRIAIAGNFYQYYNIYDLLDKSTIEINVGGGPCNPDMNPEACPISNDMYVCSFFEDGTLNFAQKFGTPLSSKIPDYPDLNKDIIILPDNSIVLTGYFSGAGTFPIGDIIVSSVEKPLLIKLDPIGQPIWVRVINFDWSWFDNLISRLSSDNEGNIYQVLGKDNYLISKYRMDGKLLWFTKVIPPPLEIQEVVDCAIYTDESGDVFSVGVCLVSEGVEDQQQQTLITKLNTHGQILYSIPLDIPGTEKSIYKDDDQNLYVSSGNAVGKYIVRLPQHFKFTGNGSWNNVSNWEGLSLPPEVLPKWDSITIETLQNDSCLLDTVQYLAAGSTLSISPGSKLIIPADIEIGHPPIKPTAITGIAKAVPEQVRQGEKIFITFQLQAGQNPTSSGVQVLADLSALGGNHLQPLFDDGTMGDAETGDNLFSYVFATPVDSPSKSYNIPVLVSDAQNRIYKDTIAVMISPKTGNSVVISQIYGGGGTTGATYKNDFVELFNRGENPVDIGGWSLQYASATGTDLFGDSPPIVLNGILQPGQYYLISLFRGSVGLDLPVAADASGVLNIPSTNGKLVLVNTNEALGCNGKSTPCNTVQMSKIVDLVGFGNANFFEKTAASAILNGNTNSLQRFGNGCIDNDDNKIDFHLATVVPRNTQSNLNFCQPKLVISQISASISSMYRNQFIEIFNAGNRAQDITGWSVQYADSTSADWKVTTLIGTLKPGMYYLIKQGYTQRNDASYLPPADATGNFYLNANSGKVAICNSNVPMSEVCNKNVVVDLVGYGSSACFEGQGPSPVAAGNTAILRKNEGCQDNNNNQDDFTTGKPTPRNRSTPVRECSNYFLENFMVDNRDGQIYPIKKYGTQTWMTANLNYNQPGSVVYDNNPANALIYGRLYMYDYAMSACPSGWHLPSVTEWGILRTSIGSVAAMMDTLYWESPDVKATNSSGFSARPGGLRFKNFEDKGITGTWWTSTLGGSVMGFYRWAVGFWIWSTNGTQIGYFSEEDERSTAESVRCIKN